MRISDWSSDVCSSDLLSSGTTSRRASRSRTAMSRASTAACVTSASTRRYSCRSAMPARRSEEHTSELQSLMRISYAVFCLKKKKHKTEHSTLHYIHSEANLTKVNEQKSHDNQPISQDKP